MVSRRAVLTAAAGLLASPALAQDARQRRRRPVEELRVGLLYLGNADDFGWTARHESARREVERRFPDRVRFTVMERVPSEDAERVAIRLARDGHLLVIGTSPAHAEGLIEAAGRMPETMFEQVGTAPTSANLATFDARAYEARYVMGALAARQSRERRIGYLAPRPSPDAYQHANAFMAGVRSVSRDIPVRLVWAGTWFDPWVEAEATRALIADGADVIAHQTDSPAPLQVAEQNGCLGFGSADDMIAFAPSAQLTGLKLDWAPLYTERVRDVLSGEWRPRSQWSGIADGTVTLAPVRNATPIAQRAAGTAERAVRADPMIAFRGPLLDRDGRERVRAGEVLSDEGLRTMDWLVQGIEPVEGT